MVVEIKRQICDGNHLKWLISAGLAWLEHNRETVNRLNVFPVPDGDTGTNMTLTLRKAYQAVADLTEPHAGIMAEHISRGALLGARGNSGVILSQLLSGFAAGVRGHDVFDTHQFAYALEKAVEEAYKAVIEPKEGTILTVARLAAQAGIEYAKNGDDLALMLERVIAAGNEALEQTPELLPVLKKAGVVDSGGQGLLYILEGMTRLLNEQPVFVADMPEHQSITDDWENALEPEDEEGYGYDVQFLIHGEKLDVVRIRTDIDAMGWSTLVVGDDRLIKVHVHVHDPGEPLSYAIALGAFIDDVVVENMQQQYHEYVKARQDREGVEQPKEIEGVAVVTVVSGEGMRYLFKSDLDAAYVISGGQTMNPSAEDFLEAIQALPNTEIVLLPNNKNIVMAAEQAATMTEGKTVRVVPTKTIPQGISAMLAYKNAGEGAPLDEVFESMVEAIPLVITAEVTFATRSVELDGVTALEGQPIGLLEGKMVASGEKLEEVVIEVLEKAKTRQRDLVTLYYGSIVRSQDAETLVARLREMFTNQEFQIVFGGQPLYPYLISVE